MKTSLTWYDKDILLLVVMPPIHNHQKTSGKPQLKYIIKNTWPVFLKTVSVLKTQGKAENLSQIGQDYGDTTTTCNCIFWNESWDKKYIREKSWCHPNKVCCLVNGKVPTSQFWWIYLWLCTMLTLGKLGERYIGPLWTIFTIFLKLTQKCLRKENKKR